MSSFLQRVVFIIMLVIKKLGFFHGSIAINYEFMLLIIEGEWFLKKKLIQTLVEKPHFSTCLKRLKVSSAIIFYQKKNFDWAFNDNNNFELLKVCPYLTYYAKPSFINMFPNIKRT
jgi:hypothetical protein